MFDFPRTRVKHAVKRVKHTVKHAVKRVKHTVKHLLRSVALARDTAGDHDPAWPAACCLLACYQLIRILLPALALTDPDKTKQPASLLRRADLIENTNRRLSISIQCNYTI